MHQEHSNIPNPNVSQAISYFHKSGLFLPEEITTICSSHHISNTLKELSTYVTPQSLEFIKALEIGQEDQLAIFNLPSAVHVMHAVTKMRALPPHEAEGLELRMKSQVASKYFGNLILTSAAEVDSEVENWLKKSAKSTSPAALLQQTKLPLEIVNTLLFHENRSEIFHFLDIAQLESVLEFFPSLNIHLHTICDNPKLVPIIKLLKENGPYLTRMNTPWLTKVKYMDLVLEATGLTGAALEEVHSVLAEIWPAQTPKESEQKEQFPSLPSSMQFTIGAMLAKSLPSTQRKAVYRYIRESRTSEEQSDRAKQKEKIMSLIRRTEYYYHPIYSHLSATIGTEIEFDKPDFPSDLYYILARCGITMGVGDGGGALESAPGPFQSFVTPSYIFREWDNADLFNRYEAIVKTLHLNTGTHNGEIRLYIDRLLHGTCTTFRPVHASQSDLNMNYKRPDMDQDDKQYALYGARIETKDFRLVTRQGYFNTLRYLWALASAAKGYEAVIHSTSGMEYGLAFFGQKDILKKYGPEQIVQSNATRYQKELALLMHSIMTDFREGLRQLHVADIVRTKDTSPSIVNLYSDMLAEVYPSVSSHFDVDPRKITTSDTVVLGNTTYQNPVVFSSSLCEKAFARVNQIFSAAQNEFLSEARIIDKAGDRKLRIQLMRNLFYQFPCRLKNIGRVDDTVIEDRFEEVSNFYKREYRKL
jgi:hypothetical protein